MPSPNRRSRSFTPLLTTITYTRQLPYDGEISMSVLDGVSLLLAAGLFIYLMVALLRADQH
jgi:K+-transporting ATPase ATPase F chain